MASIRLFIFQVKILGGQDIHVKEGSMVILKCVISNTVEKPPYVTWYLNNKVRTKQTDMIYDKCLQAFLRKRQTKTRYDLFIT